ncbi:flagellar hook protein FlgE [Evansella caseinilytica]|uniref:Flagellar hook protein FlgE n=1 Tax=Evansella caseinilytica TaxID=1503961 RepID=A0A1H3M580_9BACI|nr:flagellar basal-body rod protein FlgF [Evansella caseinilytica]SDY71892.1 flagellar hook protein FlgE [Evansella caseinilytica]
MLRAMYSGIGGLRNFQTKLDVIGNNIANVNTFGFKKGRVTFQDLVSQQMSGASTATATRGGTNPMQIGLGSSLASIDTVQTQGSLQTTTRDLDIGISGDGFFIVNNGNQSYYTRAGNFYLDSQGNLVNSNGFFVQGYGVNADGTINYAGGVGNLNIPKGMTIPPTATTLSDIRGNLNSATEVGEGTIVEHYIVDEIGRLHLLEITFTKSADNTWSYTVSSSSDSVASVGGGTTGSFTFSSGQLGNNTGTAITINFGDPNVNNMTIDIDFSQLTQFERTSTADAYYVDGSFDGTLESYSISQSGEIYGVFSNNEVRLLGQIALANFNNPEGLTKAGNNLYMASANSGMPQIGTPGEEGRGSLMGSALEMSNVDLSEEFTEMIVAQRGFQANTRIITTSDEILQELVNLKR